jgi:hypothetical protein
MNHDLEFHEGNAKEVDKAARELANLYARVFGSADGKRVLEDLFRKLDPAQPRFSPERPNSHSAARIEGRCDVWREIRNAVIVGGGRAVIEGIGRGGAG